MAFLLASNSAAAAPQGKGQQRMLRKNLVQLFAILILRLKLERKKPRLFGASHDYSFVAYDALAQMQCLELDVMLGASTTTLSYSVPEHVATLLLKKFFDAKLLHCPALRTETTVGPSTLLQVTPKGTSFVFQFCREVGMLFDQLPPLVRSNLHLMEVFTFDRGSEDRVLYLPHLLRVLFARMMGPTPNVWLSHAKPVPAKNVLPSVTLEFSFGPKVAEVELEAAVSPLHHKYFTNPELDAHVQYYSNCGLRLFGGRVFQIGRQTYKAQYSFSGKAIVQWLLDCTGLLTTVEAVDMATLLLETGLIRAITGSNRFRDSRDAFYEVGSNGRSACLWPDFVELSESLSLVLLGASITLKDVLKDPGTLHLLRAHMRRERCAENIDAYTLLLEFAKLKERLARLVEQHEALPLESSAAQVRQMAMACHSKAHHLYATFIAPEAQCDINIDATLREKAHCIMLCGTDPDLTDYLQTPVADTYDLEMLSVEEALRTPLTPTAALVAEVMAALDLIHVVYGRIAASLYRLMEADSLPKFIASLEGSSMSPLCFD